jgi:predicted transcriptional regulator
MLRDLLTGCNSYCLMGQPFVSAMDLKKKRKKAGRISQIELAQRSGVSRFRISLAESGNIVLRDHELAAIERALAREVERLAREFQDPKAV